MMASPRPNGPNPSALLAVILLATGLAGCLAPDDALVPVADPTWSLDDLSPVIYDAIEAIHIPVPGHDGKLQDTWVFKPDTDDPDARFPVFINFSPYWTNLAPDAASGGDAFSQYMIDEYVPRGYAIVLASVRGTGYSEGCFPIGGEAEMLDAYEVVDHYAQIEWSNGHVASGGKSYDGTTIQGLVGFKPHPALKLIFPVSGISELYKYNYRNGVNYGHGSLFNHYYQLGVGADINYGEPKTDHPLLLVDDFACADTPQVHANGVFSTTTGMTNDYWKERDYTRYADNVETALFFVHGFQDWNVKPDHILPWLDALPDHVIARAWLHQWEVCNDQGTSCTGHVYPMRDDWNLTMLRVLDHHLKGIDAGLDEEPRFQIQDSTGTWRHEDVWPPAHATATRLHFDDDGTLSWNQTGASGLATTGLAMNGGALRWTLDVSEPLHYAGIPVFEGNLGSSNPEAAYVLTMEVEHEGETTWINEGVLKSRLRNGLESIAPTQPGIEYPHTIEFYPQDDVLPAGSTLIITLSQNGGRFPDIPDHMAETRADVGSMSLTLPLIEAATLDWEDPQPVPMDCFAC